MRIKRHRKGWGRYFINYEFRHKHILILITDTSFPIEIRNKLRVTEGNYTIF